MDDPDAEVQIKSQLDHRDSVAKEEDQNLPTSSTSCRLNQHNQLGRLHLWNI